MSYTASTEAALSALHYWPVILLMLVTTDLRVRADTLFTPDLNGDIITLPESAINSRQTPQITLSPDTNRQRPLPVYRHTKNTYFRYGGVVTLNEGNRGWNGNAGFVVTDHGVWVRKSYASLLNHKQNTGASATIDGPVSRTEVNIMRAEQQKPNLSPSVCRKEIPLSEAFSAEARDYVVYYCGVNFYNDWQKRAQRKLNRGQTGK